MRAWQYLLDSKNSPNYRVAMKRSHHVMVVFACPDCGAPYIARQEYKRGLGSFDCWDCKTEIFRWSGEYEYANWDGIELPQVGEICLGDKGSEEN